MNGKGSDGRKTTVREKVDALREITHRLNRQATLLVRRVRELEGELGKLSLGIPASAAVLKPHGLGVWLLAYGRCGGGVPPVRHRQGVGARRGRADGPGGRRRDPVG